MEFGGMELTTTARPEGFGAKKTINNERIHFLPA